jgi:aminoglycoside phosphotransferase (APT) family kinase protein
MHTPSIDLSPATIAALVARHGLSVQRCVALPGRGTAVSVYLLDDQFALRVARDHPAAIAGLSNDAIVIPAARAAGVRTPRLIAFDDSCQLTPTPYAIYEQVRGAALDTLALPPEAAPTLWRELGRDLARLHTGVPAAGPIAQLAAQNTAVDPRSWLDELIAAKQIDPAAADWLRAWLDRLEPFASAAYTPRLCHGDINVGNIMADAATSEYRALIDWGGAHWGDPSWDFTPVSLRAVPLMLEGYRTLARLDDDATAEARIVWHHLQLAIFGLRHGRRHGSAWTAERIARLQNDLDLLLAQPRTRWIGQLG